MKVKLDIPGMARVHAGQGGLPAVQITGPHARGEMYLQGGQVTSWIPQGRDEALFVSRQARYEPGRAIRGGVPVCFPWFGALKGRSDAPAHGCVRTKPWQIDRIEQTDEGVAVTLATASDADTRRFCADEFRLEHRAIFGEALTLELTAINTGAAPFTFEAALHTYYRVRDVSGVSVVGLDGARYLDALDGRRERRQQGPVEFASEIDRIYLNTPGALAIDDRIGERRLALAASNAHAAVVWNPWMAKARALADLGDDEYREFVCVETCNVAPLAVTLAPGDGHTMRVVITTN